ncbi:MAG: M20/M25/M40 family metallo-hydrolase [Brevinemataceae bacterium]
MKEIISRDHIVKLFVELAKISSPSFHEKPVFDYVENYLEGKKVSIKRIPYCAEKFGNKQTENMIIRLAATDSSKKGLFFDAHADTVGPCENVVPVVEEDIIRSSGDTVLGADDKCGIASMLCAIDAVLEHQIPHGELVFIISSAEEVGLVGASYLPEAELANTSYGIILDSGGPVGRINLKAPYHYEYMISVIGKASHAGIAPEKGINSIKIAADIIKDLPTGRISEDTVCNIGLINGGTGRNVVPEKTTIVGEVRSLDDEKCRPILKQIENAVETHKDKAEQIKITVHLSNVGYNFSLNSPIIEFISRGLRSLGIEPLYEESCGGTNANIYTEKNVEATVISVGMEEIHGVGEYIRIKDLVDTSRLIIELIKQS